MRSEKEIRKRLDMMKWREKENWDYHIEIREIEWVLDSEKSAMCEANSNAVLAEVRARIADDMREMKRTGTEHKTVGYIRALKIIDEYISENFS